MDKIDTSDLVRISTAAQRKSVRPESLYTLIRAGALPVLEIDGVKFVHWKDVQNYVPRNYRERQRNAVQRSEASDNARNTALAGEHALSKIWDTPEEDEAWRHL
jgi:hypothetical protein